MESRESGIGSVIPVQLHFNPHAGDAGVTQGFIHLLLLIWLLSGGCMGRVLVFVSRR